ncbi:MAG: hypothetical protein KAS59_06650 [Alphaproteobacteria bacterium]|nr:hypothetical protein [Alphaproteobacteria bacterium]
MCSELNKKSIHENFQEKARIDAKKAKENNIADTNDMLCFLAKTVLPAIFERTLENEYDRINAGIFSLPHQVLDDVKGMEGYKALHKLCKEYDLCVGIKFSERAVSVDVNEKSKQAILEDYDCNSRYCEEDIGESQTLCLIVDPARPYFDSADKYNAKDKRVMTASYKPFDPTVNPMYG